jgi:glutamine cyclotransferase
MTRSVNYHKPLLHAAFGMMLWGCNNDDVPQNNTGPAIPPPTPLAYTLVQALPHDTASFTQGLQYYKGVLYESTGNPDRQPNGSRIQVVNPATGATQVKAVLPADEFGEGITLLNDKVYQLTWENRKGYVYDARTFKKLREFTYNHQGWGITNDGTYLIVSDGSSNIYYWDPETFKEVKRLSVQDHRGLRNNINELEFINGQLFANIWQSNQIVRIDTATGNITGVLDLTDLLRNYPELAQPPADVLNGIAWDSSTNRLLITGKKWPRMFEIELR